MFAGAAEVTGSFAGGVLAGGVLAGGVLAGEPVTVAVPWGEIEISVPNCCDELWARRELKKAVKAKMLQQMAK